MAISNTKKCYKGSIFSAIACPFIIQSTSEMFDGKIGIWVFAKERLDACSSKNRPVGTLEWHQVSANKQKVREMLIENVLPAIKGKWPVGWRRKAVLCQ